MKKSWSVDCNQAHQKIWDCIYVTKQFEIPLKNQYVNIYHLGCWGSLQNSYFSWFQWFGVELEKMMRAKANYRSLEKLRCTTMIRGRLFCWGLHKYIIRIINITLLVNLIHTHKAGVTLDGRLHFLSYMLIVTIQVFFRKAVINNVKF